MLKIGCIFLTIFLLISIAYADIVYLKSGKKVEGKIIEKTDEYVKIDFIGVTLTYWMNEVEKIQTGVSIDSMSKEIETVKVSEQANTAEAHFKKGTEYLYEGKWPQATTEFKDAISIDSDNLGAHFNLGCAHALVGEHEQAVEHFEKALLLETVPFDAFCYFNIAGIHTKEAISKRNTDLFKKASENFQKAAQALPNFILAIDYMNHSQMLSNPEIQEKIDNITFSVSERGVAPDSAIFLPETKIMGKAEDRILLFDAQGPPLLYFFRSPVCHLMVCESKIDFQDPANLSEEARTCLEATLKLLDNEPQTQVNKVVKWNTAIILSNSYLTTGNWDKVIEFAEKAKEIGLSYSTQYENLALAYFQKGDYAKANKAAKSALEINPNIHPEVRSGLEEIKRKTEENF